MSGVIQDTFFPTFARLKAWADALPNSFVGPSGDKSSLGEEYETVSEAAVCRGTPEDRAIVEQFVCSSTGDRLADMFGRRNGPIEWRVQLEFTIDPWERVVEYRDDGPDICFLSDRRCVKDKTWVMLRTYCRVACQAGPEQGISFPSVEDVNPLTPLKVRPNPKLKPVG